MADRLGGTFLIRIEDIDTARCTPELAQRALDDLRTIGIESDGPVLYQSTRTKAYRAALDRLRAMGLVYPSTLSRKELRERMAANEAEGTSWPHDPDGAPHYPTGERNAWRAEPTALVSERPAWRLDLEAALARLGAPITFNEVDERGSNPRTITPDATRWGDPVLWRRDGVPAYHLAVVVDDAFQGVSHIVRGTDLREATTLQRILQSLLAFPEPLYHHHDLIRDAEGRKLAKRSGDGVRFSVIG